MPRSRLTVLLVEDSPDDAEALRISLREDPDKFTLVHRETLQAGIERLAGGGIDIVLLDLSLPDSHGRQTVHRAIAAAPDVPVVVLTGLDDERVGNEAVQAGAQDYLVKATFDAHALVRTIQYAIERHKMRQREAAAAARWAHLAEENAQLAEALGRSNDLKTRFVATMSHELRSTLSAIINLTEILEDRQGERSKARHQEVVRLIRRTARESLQVLDATIELSRAEANHLPRQDREVVLRDVIGQVEQEVIVPRTSSTGLRWQVADDLPLLRIDPVKLKMILRNLISNAIKFTPNGEVVISAGRRGDSVELVVRDTGAGIAEDDLPHLFEPFRQASPAALGGGGLGLYIVHQLVKILGGTVTAESRQGAGSTFTVSLPIDSGRAS
jgi:signal transduction histidine kinase